MNLLAKEKVVGFEESKHVGNLKKLGKYAPLSGHSC